MDAQNRIWFGIWAAGARPGKLVKLDEKTDRMTEWVIPHENSSPYDVDSDRDGNIWMSDAGQWGTPKVEITRDGGIWYSPRQSIIRGSGGVVEA